MRLKSIKKTTGLKHIPFRMILDDWKGREVLTPSGFKPILACEKICHSVTKVLSLNNGLELRCHPDHRLKTLSGETKAAKDLMGDDLLRGYSKAPVSYTITDGPSEDLYDIQIPDPHWWYTAGVESHNSIVLTNNVVSCITPTGSDPDARGLDTIIVSLEMSDKKISKRQLGILTGIPLNDLKARRSDVERAMESMKKRGGHCEIIEFPPDEVSVDHIAAAVDQIRRTKGWSPKVIVLDYLDLLMSRVPAYNKDEYLRQKHVATEVRGLAKKLRVPIFTATQTNRSGVQTNGKEKDKGPENIGLNQIAESFGKAMPLDYIISINQTDEERKGAGGIPRFRFYIIKNRDGRREITIEASINYNNMRVREL